MMDWRLLLGTFTLIFFAELGDKTQLAAMASAAGHKSVWPVFLGASAALVVSTLIAVLVGGALQKMVPEGIIKAVAGGLFLLFGFLLLWSAVRARPAEALPAAAVAEAVSLPAGGVLSRVILEAAAQFEAAAVEDYAALAKKVRSPELQSLFTALALEEKRHLDRIERLAGTQAEPERKAEEAEKEKAEHFPRFLWADGALLEQEMEILAAAIQQEKAKADFYDALARSTLLGGPKAAFLALAEEERDHLRRLRNVACEPVGTK